MPCTTSSLLMIEPEVPPRLMQGGMLLLMLLLLLLLLLMMKYSHRTSFGCSRKNDGGLFANSYLMNLSLRTLSYLYLYLLQFGYRRLLLQLVCLLLQLLGLLLLFCLLLGILRSVGRAQRIFFDTLSQMGPGVLSQMVFAVERFTAFGTNFGFFVQSV